MGSDEIISWNPMGSDEIISWNPRGSGEIYEILSIKSYECIGIWWDSWGILWWSYWLKPYPIFYGSELLIIKGWSRKPARRYPPTFWGGGGPFINPVLALHHYTFSSVNFTNCLVVTSRSTRPSICSEVRWSRVVLIQQPSSTAHGALDLGRDAMAIVISAIKPCWYTNLKALVHPKGM